MAHCLSPLVRDRQAPLGLFAVRSGLPIAVRLVVAFDSETRRQGLLGRAGLGPGEALILAPCSTVHTAFMRFPLDLLFLNRAGTVLKLASGVKPWRVRGAWRGFAVVELAAGTLAESDLRAGDTVELRTIV